MPPEDLETATNTSIALCLEAHRRLLARTDGLTDEQTHSRSRLPGWSIGHVLTHLARNADGHALRLEGALRGEEVRRYRGGADQRDADIEQGAGRSAKDLLADLSEAQSRLEDVWRRSDEAGWPNRELLAQDDWPTNASPVRRLREVEMHHVDLGLGYEPQDWPQAYVDWDLPVLLRTVPDRLEDPADRGAILAWLSGRASIPRSVGLRAWG